MNFQHIHNEGSHLVYVGKRSPETRFAVLGAHDTRRDHWRWRRRWLEFTYYPRHNDEDNCPMRSWRLPRTTPREPSIDIRWRRRGWLMVYLGWTTRRHRY